MPLLCGQPGQRAHSRAGVTPRGPSTQQQQSQEPLTHPEWLQGHKAQDDTAVVKRNKLTHIAQAAGFPSTAVQGLQPELQQLHGGPGFFLKGKKILPPPGSGSGPGLWHSAKWDVISRVGVGAAGEVGTGAVSCQRKHLAMLRRGRCAPSVPGTAGGREPQERSGSMGEGEMEPALGLATVC